MNRNRAVLPALLVALALALAPAASAQVQKPLPATKIPQFAQPLPLLVLPGQGGPGMPVVLPDQGKYTLSMCEFQTNILPANSLGPKTPAPATWVWGYREGAACPVQGAAIKDSYIGPVVVARRGTPSEVTYINQLGDLTTTNVAAYKLSTDQSLMWADPRNPYTSPVDNQVSDSEGNPCAELVAQGLPLTPTCLANYFGAIPAAPHLHGGEIPAGVDGGPDAWWTGTVGLGAGRRGHGFYSKNGQDDALLGKATYIYPNTQEAAPTWFHDHVLGATRLNVYAGIAGAYVQIDPRDGNPNYPASPDLPGVTEIVPIVIQDRMFDTTGQLFFPAVGLNPEHPFWVPEFVGDAIVVNGKAWPFLDVQPRKYRFLFLNGSNARAYELFLTTTAAGIKAPSMFVIGTDQGYLDKAVEINPNLKANNKLVIMPGERYEVVIDFAAIPLNTRFVLSNSARTPYPAGAPVNSRTTGRIMEFRVACPAAGCTPETHLWNAANGTPVRVADPIKRLVSLANGAPSGGAVLAPTVKTRRLTLNEFIGKGGPLEILVNNTKYRGDSGVPGAVGRPDFEPITTQWNTTWYSEIPYEGETEVWEIVNLTADAHPIHPHLVAFQLLNRQTFDVKAYDAAYNLSFPLGVYMPGYGPPSDYGCGTNPTPPGEGVPIPITNPDGTQTPCVLGGNPDPFPLHVGLPVAPLPSEEGWKDTVIAYPGQITRFVVRFAPTTLANTETRENGAAYEFNPNGGHGYVWHCHIIDHEDNEMMRPMSVVANPSAGGLRFELPQLGNPNP